MLRAVGDLERAMGLEPTALCLGNICAKALCLAALQN